MAKEQSELEKQLNTDELSGHSVNQANSDTEEENGEFKVIETPIAVTDDGYPRGFRLTAIVISLMLGTFLVALDNVRCIFRLQVSQTQTDDNFTVRQSWVQLFQR